MVFLLRAVIARFADGCFKDRIVRRYRSPISEPSEVLRRIEAEGARITEGTGLSAPVKSAVRLGAILDHPEPFSLRDLHDRIHVAWFSVQMDHHDRTGLRCYCIFNARGIDIAGGWVGLDQYRPESVLHDRQDRRNICVRRHDHLGTPTESLCSS